MNNIIKGYIIKGLKVPSIQRIHPGRLRGREAGNSVNIHGHAVKVGTPVSVDSLELSDVRVKH